MMRAVISIHLRNKNIIIVFLEENDVCEFWVSFSV